VAKKLLIILLLGLLITLVILTAGVGIRTWQRERASFAEWGEQNAILGAEMVEYALFKSMANGIFTMAELFSADYQPVSGSQPRRYHTRYDSYMDRNLLRALDGFLESPLIYYAYAVRNDGYIPTHADPKWRKRILPEDDQPLHVEQVGDFTGFRKWISPDGFRYFEFSSPIVLQGRIWGSFRVGIPVQLLYADVRRQIIDFLILGIPLAALLALLIYLLIRTQLKPLAELSRATGRMTEGDLSVHCNVKGRSELAELARSFNIMMQTIRVTQESLERRVQERTAALSAIIENSPTGILLVDAESRCILEVNRECCRLIGRSRDEIVGESCNTIFCRDADEACPILDQDMESHHAEASILDARGQVIPVLKNAVRIRIDGKVHILEAFIDISEQKKAHDKLREREQFLDAIIENIPDMVFVKDAENLRFIRMNSGAERILGIPAKDMLGKNDFDCFPQEQAAEFTQADRAVLHSGKLLDVPEEEIETRHRGKRILHTKKIPVTDGEGRLLFLLGISEDITERTQMESAIRDNLVFLQALLDTIPNPVFYKDCDGNYQGCNRAYAEQIMGLERDRIIGASPFDLSRSIPRELAQLYHEKDMEVVRTGHPQMYEGIAYCPDGERRDFLFNKAAYRDADGNIAGVVGVMVDITDQKTTEKMLRSLYEKREELEHIIRHSPAVAFLWKAEAGWPVEYVSDNVSQLGFEADALLSGQLEYAKMIHPDDLPRVTDEVVRHTKEGPDTLSQEYRLIKPDGTVIWIYDQTWIRRDFYGEVTHYQGIVLDITERKNVERELMRIRTAIDDASDGVMLTDRQGRPVYCNQAFQFLSGYTLEHLQQENFQVLFENRERFHDCYSAIQEGRNWHGELILLNRDGEAIPVDLRGGAVVDEQYSIAGMVFLLMDLREQKKTEAHRKRMEMQLHHAQKLESIGQLAAGIAHEINTPVQFIGDNTRFLQDAYKDLAGIIRECMMLLEAARQYDALNDRTRLLQDALDHADVEYLMAEIPKAVQQSLEGVKRISGIVSAMKEFSHPGVNQKNAVDINKAVSSTITVARNEWKYVANLETDFDPEVASVPCMPGEFNQAILNILVNAAHAIEETVDSDKGEKGTIHVSTRKCDNKVEIRIRDNGPGIAEDIRNRVFDPFFTTKDVGRGTGQGLSIAYDVIVNKHQGSLTFETEEGCGTEFLICIPLHAVGNTSTATVTDKGKTAL
jgi:PAS domain S-box-containing protein